ncbi:phosphomevalonate kinase [Salpingoeca rosetta]|uniref:Phosphomevalonate kinase n=1 Tax=Salpingoeca rosetta (strain ATCC 50818 / BSB-021) TaxID=946362 RepID=F2UN14_SALR5|nr:phosphomevalonate kinase [Salpingoeca rosetta]EGD78513.1 phosphomevalonate kinase [Salpingoeca rosetta]|eukprot:XP_004989462.1 phosphomevalonate kinase [Salpingoeca rosetta]
MSPLRVVAAAAAIGVSVYAMCRIAKSLCCSKLDGPKCVIILSGKRKCGKDYLSSFLHERLGTFSSVVRLSGPLKEQFAKDHGLDYEELLSDSGYKEKYRKDMIAWGEKMRNADPGFFCRLATATATAPIWIVTDARRPSDIEYFKARYPVVTVRISSTDATRKQRGWVFTPDVDDAESECALDNYGFDQTIENNSTGGLTPALDRALQRVINAAVKHL